MISLAGRDILHGWGKFVFTGIGLGLLIGVTLTMAGVYRGMVDDAKALLDNSTADLWVVQKDTLGPYAEPSSIYDDHWRAIRGVQGVADATNVTYLTMQVRHGNRDVRAMVTGMVMGEPGSPGGPPYLVGTIFQNFQLEGAQLTLAANIVTTAVTQAKLASQIRANEESLTAQEEQLVVARHRLRLGQASEDDVLALTAEAEQTRAGIPVLETRHKQMTHLLATLSGEAPSAVLTPSFEMEDFSIPTNLLLTALYLFTTSG